MAVYFRFINNHGKVEIQVLKTLFNRGANENDFKTGAKVVDSDKFLEKFPVSSRTKLITDMIKLEELTKYSVRPFGPVIGREMEGNYLSGVIIGDRTFYNFYKDDATKEEAISYGKKMFQESTMNEVIRCGILNEPNYGKIIEESDSFHPYKYCLFFRNGQKLSFEEYEKIRNEISELVRVRDVKEYSKKNNKITIRK